MTDTNDGGDAPGPHEHDGAPPSALPPAKERGGGQPLRRPDPARKEARERAATGPEVRAVRRSPATPRAERLPVENGVEPAGEARLPPSEERIAKVIARAGIASRRDAEAMIEAGRVTLNGAPVLSPALNVGPADRITVDGEPLPLRERTRLWLFHKPRGLVTTFRDPQGRPTVFEALPEELPRVVAIGRLDINTEGLLLLTNDGGLAKVIAHPETGWTRRYRVRARGEITQEALDGLRNGITVDEMEYGPIEAHLDRVQGDNTWLTLSLREGKNREVKRVLEHLGMQVNRLIRLSFGPFQLGELEQGLVEEIRTRVLKDQLGRTLAEQAEVDFESPVREPIAPFGSESRRAPATGARPERQERPERQDRPDRPERPGRAVAPRRAGEGGRDGDARRFGREGRPAGGPPPGRGRPPPVRATWRAGEDDRGEPRPRRQAPRDDPQAERVAAAARPRERVRAIEGGEGRRVLVERLVGPKRRDDDRDDTPGPGSRPARGRVERPRSGGKPPFEPRGDGRERPGRGRSEGSPGARPPRGRFGAERPTGERPTGGAPPGDRSSRSRPPRDGAAPKRGGPPGRGGERLEGRAGKPAGRPRPEGSRPGGSRPGAGRPEGNRPGGSRPGGDRPKGGPGARAR